MATVNLGNIKLNWKGAYNAGTAYVIDDVVSYNGSSYVCIAATTGNLPTVTAKWNQMSAAGTNGTDVGTTITTQGDLLYRDGSGLQRLAAGTNGQALLTGGAGANPSWGTITSGVKKVGSISKNLGINAGNRYRNPYHISAMNYTFTPTNTSAGGSTFVWNAKTEISHDNHPAGCIEVSEDGGSNWVNASNKSTTEGAAVVQSGGNLSWQTDHKGRYPSFAFDSNGNDFNRGSNGFASGIYQITGGSVTNLQWRMLVWSENATPDLCIGGSANSGNTTHGSISLTNLTIWEI